MDGGQAGRTRWRVVLAGAAVCLAVASCSAGSSGDARPADEGPSAVSTVGRSTDVEGTTGSASSGARWDPASARMPADAVGAPSGCAATWRPEGWLGDENALAGTPSFTVPGVDEPVVGDVLGYADRTSAACGDVVGVSLSGRGRVRLEAYRIGAYRGAHARLVWSSPEVDVVPRPSAAPQRGTRLIEPGWPVSVRVPITEDWPPGLYLLVPEAGAGPAGPAIPLVVRDDVGREPVLFVASTLTWNAYGEYGGISLYHGAGAGAAARFASRATVVSFRRPLVGAGYRQLVYMDLPVVEQLEATGLDAAYTTDADLDRRPSVLLAHAEVVFGGHSEYWTRRSYDALAVARAVGVNLVFLGANNLWWHARLESSPGLPADAPPDREVVWRVYSADPNRRSPANLTLLWSQWPEHRDGASILGQSHAGIGVHGGYQLFDVPSWMLAGTGLHAGTPDAPGSVLPLAVGNEADGYNPAGANPAGTAVLAAGVLTGGHGPVLASVSYSVAPSGAAVFAAGSTDWSCSLSGSCADQDPPASTVSALRAWTANVLRGLSTLRAGLAHPAPRDDVPPAPAQLREVLAPGAIGTYGGSEASEESGHTPRKT